MQHNKVEKPNDWPANAIECRLENISLQLSEFKKNPNYKNKEVLISLVTEYDLNQFSSIGIFRTTKYEVALLNCLLLESQLYGITSLKTYLYDLIGKKARSQKIMNMCSDGKVPLMIEAFDGLLLQLNLYYISYLTYSVEKSKSFAQTLIDCVEKNITYAKENESHEVYLDQIKIITNAYINILNDISYFVTIKVTKIWAFNRDEIFILFKLAANLNKIIESSPIERPLKGVLMTSISNYILKSRNNYNDDFICKYINPETAKASVINHEIWMAKIEKLNDAREQKIIQELFENSDWLKFDWVKDVNLRPTRKYYVSSFCKSIDNLKMKEMYGECVYGYKHDSISQLIAPIFYPKTTNKPMLSQVLAFDILYDTDETKDEISYLCKIIDCFDISDAEKNIFLQDTLQYWNLSVKDPKWAYEKERRYVLFLYDDYEYTEINMDDDKYLKLKTSLFIEPDFILGTNPVRGELLKFINEKRAVLSDSTYLFCLDCLNRDYDVVSSVSNNYVCPICKSKNISVHEFNFSH